MAAILNSAILNLAILDSAILEFPLKLTHTCTRLVPTICTKNFTHTSLPTICTKKTSSWIHCYLLSDCTQKHSHSLWFWLRLIQSDDGSHQLEFCHLEFCHLGFSHLVFPLKLPCTLHRLVPTISTTKTLSLHIGTKKTSLIDWLIFMMHILNSARFNHCHWIQTPCYLLSDSHKNTLIHSDTDSEIQSD